MWNNNIDQLSMSCRFCLSETSCPQEDHFPPSLCVKVNGKPCNLPVGSAPALSTTYNTPTGSQHCYLSVTVGTKDYILSLKMSIVTDHSTHAWHLSTRLGEPVIFDCVLAVPAFIVTEMIPDYL